MDGPCRQYCSAASQGCRAQHHGTRCSVALTCCNCCCPAGRHRGETGGRRRVCQTPSKLAAPSAARPTRRVDLQFGGCEAQQTKSTGIIRLPVNYVAAIPLGTVARYMSNCRSCPEHQSARARPNVAPAEFATKIVIQTSDTAKRRLGAQRLAAQHACHVLHFEASVFQNCARQIVSQSETHLI